MMLGVQVAVFAVGFSLSQLAAFAIVGWLERRAARKARARGSLLISGKPDPLEFKRRRWWRDIP